MVIKLRNDYLLISTLLLTIGVIVAAPQLIPHYPQYIHWNTLLILATLFLITTGLKDSRYLDILAKNFINRVHRERALAMSLILMAFFLSMVITNDVALLILVPLTISFKKFMQGDIRKLVIFEALAVNAGSALTPIGNPQNIYIWHLWEIGFLNFIIALLPMVCLMLLFLLVFAAISFPSKNIEKLEGSVEEGDRTLGIISGVLLVAFILSMEFNVQLYLVPVIFIVYLVAKPRTYLDVDWALLAVFTLFFIDFNAIGNMPIVGSIIPSNGLYRELTYIYGALFSQFMSNVPSAILLSNFTTNFKALTYGVSVGGNGVAVASLANLIALRFFKERKIWVDFHKYSLPYFLLTFILGYFIFFQS